MTTESLVFPLECPDCKAWSGFPYEAATMKGSTTTVRIGLRCRECRHEWKLEMDTEPVSNPGQEE